MNFKIFWDLSRFPEISRDLLRFMYESIQLQKYKRNKRDILPTQVTIVFKEKELRFQLPY
jgi:hypothetical protein